MSAIPASAMLNTYQRLSELNRVFLIKDAERCLRDLNRELAALESKRAYWEDMLGCGNENTATLLAGLIACGDERRTTLTNEIDAVERRILLLQK